MAYSLTLPDGTVVDGINDKYSREEALSRIREKMPEAFDTRPASQRFYGDMPSVAAPTTPPRKGLMASFSKGAESLGSSSLTGIKSVFGNAADAAKEGIADNDRLDAKYAQEVSGAKIKKVFEEQGLGAAAAEVMRQFPHVLAEQAPNIALTIAGAKGGALIGGGVAGPVGAAVGAVVGGAGALLPQYVGSNVERQARAQQEAGQAIAPDVGKAALTGAAQSALDYASLRLLGGNVVGKWLGMKTSEEALKAAAIRSLKASAGLGAAKGLAEIPTEVAQQVLERAQAGLSLTDDKALAEYGEAAYAAGLVGPSLGGVAGVADRSAARGTIEQQEREKAAADAAKAAKDKAAFQQTPEYLNSVEGLTAQRSKLHEQKKELVKQIKHATGEEKDALTEQHKGVLAQIKELSGRIDQAKKSPLDVFIDSFDKVAEPTVRGKPAAPASTGDFLPGVSNEDAGVSPAEAARPKDFAPDYQNADATDAFLLSLTDPAAYKLWLKQSAQDSYDPITGNQPNSATRTDPYSVQWQQAPSTDVSPDAYELGESNAVPYGQGPLAEGLEDLDATTIDSRVQRMRERRLQEQEDDLYGRAVAATENWSEKAAQERTATGEVHPPFVRYGRRNHQLAQLLRLNGKKMVAGEYSDNDIQAAIDERIRALKSEQQALGNQKLYDRRVDEQGDSVTGLDVDADLLNKMAANDAMMEQLQHLRQLYARTANTTPDNSAKLLDEFSATPPQREKPKRPVVEPAPIPTKKAIFRSPEPASTLSDKRPVLRMESVTPNERAWRKNRKEEIAQKRDQLLRYYETLLTEIHRGEFFGSQFSPRRLFNKDKAESRYPTKSKQAAAMIRQIVELSVAEAAEAHALNGDRLSRTQSQVYSHRIANILRDYLSRAQANANPGKPVPMPTLDMDSQTREEDTEVNARNVPFGDINKAMAAMRKEVQPEIEKMQRNLLRQTPKRQRAEGERQLVLTSQTEASEATRRQRERGTTKQQEQDYVYERVQEALETPERLDALERMERAQREGIFPKRGAAAPTPAAPTPEAPQVPGRAPKIAPPTAREALELAEQALRGSNRSTVTPQLLADIEALATNPTPEGAASVVQQLRQISDVNQEDVDQQELFTGQDTPQVRIIRRTPFLLRRLINSQQVQVLRDMVRPLDKLIAAYDKQIEELNAIFDEQELRLMDRATNGAYSRVLERFEAWKDSLSTLRMLADRVDSLNIEGYRNNYEAVEQGIQGVRAGFDEELAKLNDRIFRELGKKPKDKADNVPFYELYGRLQDLKVSLLRGETFESPAPITEIEARERDASEKKNRLLPMQTAKGEATRTTLTRDEQKRQQEARKRAQENEQARLQAGRELVARIRKAEEVDRKAKEAAQENLQKLPVSAKQRVVSDVIPNKNEKMPPRVRTAKIITKARPDTWDSLGPRWAEEASEEGRQIGEAEYDALGPIERISVDEWRGQRDRVTEAKAELERAEAALTDVRGGSRTLGANASHANIRSPGSRSFGQEKVKPAKLMQPAPRKGNVMQIRALQRAVEKAEENLLQEMAVLDEFAARLKKKMSKTEIDKALRLSEQAEDNDKIEQLLRIERQTEGGKRPGFGSQIAAAAAEQRAEGNAHPAEQVATRPAYMPHSPKTSNSPPYTKKMAGEKRKRAKPATPFGEKLDKALGGDTVFRSGEDTGITPEEATAGAAKAHKLLPGVKWFGTRDEVTPEVQAALAARGETPATVKGGLLPDGTVFIIAENHKSAADLDATIQHEIIGHYRLERTMFGSRTGMRLMTDLASKYLPDMQATYELSSQLGFSSDVQGAIVHDAMSVPEAGRPLYMLREIVARASEMKPASWGEKAKRFWKEFVGHFKHVARGLGLNWNLSDADVFYMIKQAQNGELRSIEGGDTIFRTATPSDIKAIGDRFYQQKSNWKTANERGALGHAFRTTWIDRHHLIRVVSERMENSLRGLNMLYFARMADRVNQFVSEAMSHGPITLEKVDLKNGEHAYMFRANKGANVADIIKVLKTEDFNSWASYMALERAEKVGYDKLFANRPDKLAPEQRQRLLEYGRNNKAFQDARAMYREYNSGLVDFAVHSGYLSKHAGEEMKSRDYIPFYRKDDSTGKILMEGEDRPIEIGNIRDNKELAALFGSDKDLNDPYANIARNARLLIGGAIRNQAAKNTAMELANIGLGHIVNTRTHNREATGRNVIHFRMDGQERSFWMDTSQNPAFADIPADLFVKGMEGIVTTLPTFWRLMSIPTRVLRDFITRNPLYAARQLARDPLHAWMASGADFSITGNALKRVGNLFMNRDETGNLLRERGMVGGQVIQGTDEDMRKIMKRLHAGHDVIDMLASKADQLSVSADAATRAALYDNFRNQHGMDEFRAYMATMDSVNFATRGASPSVQAINMMIPFFNAQIQGLDSVYRAVTGQMPFNDKMKARQRLATRAALMAASTMLYYAMVEDEEWYQNTPENIRLSNWLFKIPGVDEPIRIPIPFEFGLLFKAVPETILMASKSDPEAKAAWAALRNMGVNTIPGASSAGIPAAMKPGVEAMANHSFFTGRSIVPEYLQGEDPKNQYTPNTTEAAKTMSAIVDALTPFSVSPMKIEHIVRGYTAGIGFATLQMIDATLSGTESEAPDKKNSQRILTGPLFQPVDGNAIISRAYDAVKRIEAAQGRMRNAETEFDREEMQRIAAEEATDLAMTREAGRFKKQVGELSKLQRQVKFHPTMTGAEKREMIDQLQQRKIELARSFETQAQLH